MHVVDDRPGAVLRLGQRGLGAAVLLLGVLLRRLGRVALLRGRRVAALLRVALRGVRLLALLGVALRRVAGRRCGGVAGLGRLAVRGLPVRVLGLPVRGLRRVGHQSFSSLACTYTVPCPDSSSWNASPEPRPIMSRHPSAVDSLFWTWPRCAT